MSVFKRTGICSFRGNTAKPKKEMKETMQKEENEIGPVQR